jgi:MarR family transcriptional regulator, organic hydroperoxide resistance regulator
MKPEETIDFHIRWVWAKIAKAYNTEASKHGGTMAIGYLLLCIDKDGTPSTRLGPRMGMEPTSLSRILKSMEEMKFIRRMPDKEDKRVVKICLTARGKEMRDKSKMAVIRFNEHIQNNIPQPKLNTFFEVMDMVNDLLDNENLFEEKKSRKAKKSLL